MKTSFLVFVLGVSVALASCGDDTPKPTTTGTTQPANDNPNNKTKTELLTGHTWKLTGFTQRASGSTVATDLFASGIPNCQKDDLYKFAVQDSVATIDDNTIKCAPSSANTGTWYFKNAESTLALIFPGQNSIGLSGDLTLNKLGETKMELKQTVSGSEYTSTYTAQ